MTPLEWVLALLALGFLGATTFTLIRIEDKITDVVDELRLLNKDRHGAEFDRAVDAERARLDAENH